MDRSYDEDLYPLLREVSPTFDETVWLQDHIRISHEERDQFLNNEIENPQFTYSSQKPRVSYLERVDKFLTKLNASEAPEVVIDLYKRKMVMQQQRDALVAASLTEDDDLFFEASVELYGRPKMQYFSYVAKRVLKLCHDKKKKHPGEARRLRRIFSKISTDSTDIDVTILPPVVNSKKMINTADEVMDVFKETFERCGIKGWTIRIDRSGHINRFAVNSHSKTVYIPSDKELVGRPKPLTDVHVRALAEHEIGVHVRRGYEASQGPLRLLETGLDNYLVGEEGLASYVQQQIEGGDEFYGFDRYLAASLAVGMDGEIRDFRAVFSLMTDYYTMKLDLDEEVKMAPFRAAWDVCVRTFRGTTGQSAGCIYTKDIVYMEGNIGIWNMLIDRPEIFESLFVGKFNPLLPRHMQTLQTLEILKE